MHAGDFASIACGPSECFSDAFGEVVRLFLSLSCSHGPFSKSFGVPDEFSYTVHRSAIGR